MKKIILWIGAALWLLFLCLSAYNYYIYTDLPLPNATYLVDNGDQVTITRFDKGKAMIYVLVREDGVIRYGGKYTMKASAEGYNHLFGDYYFTSKTAFSLRRLENGDRMGILFLKRINHVGYDFQSQKEFAPVKKAFDGRWSFAVFPEYVLISDQRNERILRIPQEYEKYLSLLDALT